MKKIGFISFVVLSMLNWHCRKASVTEELDLDTGAGGYSAGPNIIFLLADDMRYDALGYTGNKYAITPNIDSLAARGTNFKNTYVTSAICAISRASIFTGQYASRHQITNFDKSFSFQALKQTYPGILRRNGYYTGFIGKFGVGNLMPTHAFDYWKGYPGHGGYFYTDSSGKPVHETVMMEREAEDFLNKRDTSKPFCLSISFKAPHSEDGVTENNGFRPDPFFDDWYTNVQFPYPETYADYYTFPGAFRTNAQGVDNEGRVRWQGRFSTDQYQTTTHAIYRLVSGVDRAVGQIRAYLKAKGLDKNTIIVFTSDNGYYMGEHGLEGKWYGHEESIRVPLVVYDPRLPQQRRVSEEMVLNIDYAPTILAWAGLRVPSAMQGEPIQPLLSAYTSGWRTEFFYEHPYESGDGSYIPKSVGIVTQSWKYMLYYNGSPANKVPVYQELFDETNDPHEKNNLFRASGQQARIADLKSKVAYYEQHVK